MSDNKGNKEKGMEERIYLSDDEEQECIAIIGPNDLPPSPPSPQIHSGDLSQSSSEGGSDGEEEIKGKEVEISINSDSEEMERREPKVLNLNLPSLISELEGQIEMEPGNLGLHENLADCYMRAQMYNKLDILLRQTYDILPFTKKMCEWWIQLSKEVALQKLQKLNVLDVFRKVIDIIPWSDICDQYISYALQLLKEDTINQEEVRKTFEEVLDIWGAHFTKGFALWDRYLHFEKDIQIKLLEESMAEGKEQKDSEDEGALIIRRIYRRMLQNSILEIDIIWDEYIGWEKSESEKSRMEGIYKRTSSVIEKSMELEEIFDLFITEISEVGVEYNNLPESISEYISSTCGKNYSKHRTFMERIVESDPLNTGWWDIYMDYEERLNKNMSIHEGLLRRAVRCSRDDPKYKLKWVRLMEKEGKPYQQIHTFINLVLTLGQGNLQYQYILRKELCEISARAVGESEISAYREDNNNTIIKRMRDNYNNTIKFLAIPNKSFPTALREDLQSKLTLNLAELEAYKIHSESAVVSLMEKYMKIHGSEHIAWLNYIKFGRALGNPRLMRNLCKRGIEYAKEFEIIAKAWVDWEKMFGDIRTFLECERKIDKRRARETIKNKLKRINPEKGEGDSFEQRSPNKYRKISDTDSNVNKAPPELSERNTIFIKNLPQEANEGNVHELLEQIDLEAISVRVVRTETGKSKRFAYVDMKSMSMAEEACLKLDDTELQGYKLMVKISKPPQKEITNSTVFINNLSFDVNEQILRDHFRDCGEIEEVRLITNEETGRPKGFAYIEFKSRESVEQALKLNKQRLQSRSLNIQSATPQTSQNIKSTIHVKNFPFSTTEEEIINLFKGQPGTGDIKRVLIIRDGEGRSRGFGFVEFEEEDSVSGALQLNNVRLGSRNILIGRSQRAITEGGGRRGESRRTDYQKKEGRNVHDKEKSGKHQKYLNRKQMEGEKKKPRISFIGEKNIAENTEANSESTKTIDMPMNIQETEEKVENKSTTKTNLSFKALFKK